MLTKCRKEFWSLRFSPPVGEVRVLLEEGIGLEEETTAAASQCCLEEVINGRVVKNPCVLMCALNFFFELCVNCICRDVHSNEASDAVWVRDFGQKSCRTNRTRMVAHLYLQLNLKQPSWIASHYIKWVTTCMDSKVTRQLGRCGERFPTHVALIVSPISVISYHAPHDDRLVHISNYCRRSWTIAAI